MAENFFYNTAISTYEIIFIIYGFMEVRHE